MTGSPLMSSSFTSKSRVNDAPASNSRSVGGSMSTKTERILLLLAMALKAPLFKSVSLTCPTVKVDDAVLSGRHNQLPAGKNDRSKRRPASCSTPHAFNECERVTLDTIRSVSNCISAVPGEGGKGAAAERHGAR